MRNEQRITVVIPCYNVERHIEGVAKAVPDFVDHIILVDDASKDGTRQIIDSLEDARTMVLHHEQNQGVGGAMLTGYRKAMELGDDIVVKIDGDGQMDCAMIAPLIDSMAAETDMAKGNRLFNLAALKSMPRVRRFGNGVLGFMVKAASGYWEISDPVNGFFAIRTSTLRKMDLGRVAKDYFFEFYNYRDVLRRRPYPRALYARHLRRRAVEPLHPPHSRGLPRGWPRPGCAG